MCPACARIVDIPITVSPGPGLHQFPMFLESLKEESFFDPLKMQAYFDDGDVNPHATVVHGGTDFSTVGQQGRPRRTVLLAHTSYVFKRWYSPRRDALRASNERVCFNGFSRRAQETKILLWLQPLSLKRPRSPSRFPCSLRYKRDSRVAVSTVEALRVSDSTASN